MKNDNECWLKDKSVCLSFPFVNLLFLFRNMCYFPQQKYISSIYACRYDVSQCNHNFVCFQNGSCRIKFFIGLLLALQPMPCVIQNLLKKHLRLLPVFMVMSCSVFVFICCVFNTVMSLFVVFSVFCHVVVRLNLTYEYFWYFHLQCYSFTLLEYQVKSILSFVIIISPHINHFNSCLNRFSYALIKIETSSLHP